MTANNSINSPSLGNIVLANSSVLVTNSSGVGLLSSTIPANDTFTSTGALGGIKTQFLYSQTAQINSNLVSSAYTASGVLASSDLVGGIVLAIPAAATSLQLPTASDFNTFLSSFMTFAVPINTVIIFTLENTSATNTVTLTANTNFTIINSGGTPTILPNISKSFKIRKSANTPTYNLWGG